jgi:hypothetical protein
MNLSGSNPQPMEMDDEQGNRGDWEREWEQQCRQQGISVSNLSLVPFNSASFIPNLESLGIAVGLDENNRVEALLELNRAVQAGAGGKFSCDKKQEVLELEEKELDDEEVVDKLLLQNICGEIMDVGGDDFALPTNHSNKKQCCKKGVGSQMKRSKMKGIFCNSNGFRDPSKHRFVSDSTREHNLAFIVILEMGRSNFNDWFLKNLWVGKKMWHCKAPEDRSRAS